MKIIFFWLKCYVFYMKYKFFGKFEWCRKLEMKMNFKKFLYLKMVLRNYYCWFWCNVLVKECIWEIIVRVREVKWGY